MRCSDATYFIRKKLDEIRKQINAKDYVSDDDRRLLSEIGEASFDLSEIEDLLIWLEDENYIGEVI